VRRLPAKAGDIAAILLGAALFGAVAFAAIKYNDGRSRPNFGFGPEWDCAYAGHGDPVCIKRPGAE
jgi:hypothetical protein